SRAPVAGGRTSVTKSRGRSAISPGGRSSARQSRERFDSLRSLTEQGALRLRWRSAHRTDKRPTVERSGAPAERSGSLSLSKRRSPAQQEQRAAARPTDRERFDSLRSLTEQGCARSARSPDRDR